MGMDSHSSLDIQKMCQLDTRKLVFLIIVVAAFVLMVQFFSIPYGSVLLSIFPSEKVPLLAQSEHSAADASPKAEVLFVSYLVNASVSSNSSHLGEDVVANKGKGVEGIEGDGGGTQVNEDFELETGVASQDVIQFGDVDESQDSSESIRIREHVHDLRSKSVSTDNVQQETSLTLEKSQSRDRGSASLSPALPPVDSSIILAPLDSNLGNPVISADANNSSLGEPATTSMSVMNDKTDIQTGQGNTETNLLISSKSIQNDSLGMQTGGGTLQNDSSMTPSSVQMELLPVPVKTISDMYLQLLKGQSSSHSMIPRWPSPRDQEILSARSQIENPPMVKNDRQLYAPLFRNVSMFKRSYELMEQTLKVYIYKEGAQPVFHQPETKGIYASEGWFMKQMEGNRRFTVKDPKKAHLFYLPFSPRRLEQFLYVPNSHSKRNLVAYLKSYLDLISTKYPFWNRTGGADHFLVGCHDWTPDETWQYMNTCIRALCNSDVSEDFSIGKDAALPETMIRLARDPLRDLGGKPASKRQIFAFFAGGMHGYVRPILLKYWENKDSDMKISGYMPRGKRSKANYANNMKNSKYCICAKGFEVNSPRVVEAIFYECVPVIISDNFVPPFLEVFNWEAFAIFIPEKDIPNLKNILLSISPEKYLRLQMNVRRVQQHFLWHTKPVKYDIFHMILHSVWYNRVYQINSA